MNEDISTVFGREVITEVDEKHLTQDKETWDSYYDSEDGCEFIRRILPAYEHFMTQFGYEVKWGQTPYFFDLINAPEIIINQDIRAARCQKLRYV